MFVCQRNSCCSQMAEGFARTLDKDKIEVTFSGLEASRVHPICQKLALILVIKLLTLHRWVKSSCGNQK